MHNLHVTKPGPPSDLGSSVPCQIWVVSNAASLLSFGQWMQVLLVMRSMLLAMITAAGLPAMPSLVDAFPRLSRNTCLTDRSFHQLHTLDANDTKFPALQWKDLAEWEKAAFKAANASRMEHLAASPREIPAGNQVTLAPRPAASAWLRCCLLPVSAALRSLSSGPLHSGC